MNKIINIFHHLLFALGLNILLFIPAFIYKTDKLTDLSYSLTFILLASMAFAINSIGIMKIIIFVMVLLWALRLGIFLFIRIRKMDKDRRFDGIRESFTKFLKFWVLQGLAVWVILLPALFFIGSEAKSVFWPGLIIWSGGLFIEAIADIQKYQFSKKHKDKFIDLGLWKYSRHPNYFGEMACWIGLYIFTFPSLDTLPRLMALASPLFIIILLLFVTGLPPLEKYADEKWGKNKDYQEYKRRTSILIPWFRKK